MVVAGTHSGVGKTTVATGLMAALRRRGLGVAAAKIGPDFIDPGYHEVATGRPGRNLDVFCSGAEALPALAARAAHGSDLLVVEGVMGLFDGVGATTTSSTAHVAALLGAPVLLVVDAASMSGSVAALVHGYDDMLRRTTARGIAGIVLNKVGSDTHEAVLRRALDGAAPVVGVLRRDDACRWHDRHLGLVPVIEQPEQVARSVRRLGEVLGRALHLEEIERIARAAPPLHPAPLPEARRTRGAPVRVAVASGPAFSFAYPDNLERLAEAGAELCPFDPLEAPRLPDGTQALYAGGGFPEVFAEALSANTALRDDVRRRVGAGMPTWAECGGMLWLSRSVEGHELCGVLPAGARMRERITVGYRTARVRSDNPVAPRGSELRGHELHYSALAPPGDALELSGTGGSRPEGYASGSLLATYLHLHLGADAAPAERFVEAAVKAASAAAATSAGRLDG